MNKCGSYECNRDSAQDESEQSVKRPTLWSYLRQLIDGAATKQMSEFDMSGSGRMRETTLVREMDETGGARSAE
jgi:hypothetical protein